MFNHGIRPGASGAVGSSTPSSTPPSTPTTSSPPLESLSAPVPISPDLAGLPRRGASAQPPVKRPRLEVPDAVLHRMRAWVASGHPEERREDAAAVVLHNMESPSTVALQLDSLELRELPPCLDALPQLRILQVRENALSDPPDFSALPQLDVLGLALNRLTMAPDLRAQTRLRVLSLEENELTAPPDFGPLGMLKNLDLSANRIRVPPDLSPSPQLESVDLSDNDLVAMPDARGLPNLREMDLGYNLLTTVPRWIADLPDTLDINLTGNPLSAETIAFLRGLRSGPRIHYGIEAPLDEGPPACLREGFDALCARYLAWAEQEASHRAGLDRALAALAFPHAGFRPGQRELANAVYRSAAAGRCLLTQAPTGIGKTVATLFPLLKARPARKLDKIFFLTAKTSGRAVALSALRTLGRDQAPLRVLELAAREKVCEHPGKACNGEACPLARGFYDRLPAARADAARAAWLDRAELRRVALAHEVCPYFLAQEMVRWCDVVVGDYNYYFDGSAFLYALMRDEEWRVALLVDEAHNLLGRARGMYSAALDPEALTAVQRKAPSLVKRTLGKLQREWQLLQRDQVAAYQAHDEIPERFERALQESVSVMAEHFNAQPADAQGPLQQFFFDALQFARLAESFGKHSVFESTLGEDDEGSQQGLAIRNLLPAPFLEARFADCASAACFSGTLAPFSFYRDTLGLPENTATLEVGSPFRSEQLTVRVAMDVSTRFRDRAGSLHALTRIIAMQFARSPGNYLAFFSSFDYLASASTAFAAEHPDVPVWVQSRGMREADREAFLARFESGGRGIGFAVLGGAFGEGIDLPGDRLVGAFVASLGMPQHNEPNEVMRERMEVIFGDGYAYTYVNPGLQKVVQAAGRVIRTEQDAGVLYLLDDRFAQREIRELLPAWWRIEPLFARGAASR